MASKESVNSDQYLENLETRYNSLQARQRHEIIQALHRINEAVAKVWREENHKLTNDHKFKDSALVRRPAVPLCISPARIQMHDGSISSVKDQGHPVASVALGDDIDFKATFDAIIALHKPQEYPFTNLSQSEYGILEASMADQGDKTRRPEQAVRDVEESFRKVFNWDMGSYEENFAGAMEEDEESDTAIELQEDRSDEMDEWMSEFFDFEAYYQEEG